jgi:hypothetical protein
MSDIHVAFSAYASSSIAGVCGAKNLKSENYNYAAGQNKCPLTRIKEPNASHPFSLEPGIPFGFTFIKGLHASRSTRYLQVRSLI